MPINKGFLRISQKNSKKMKKVVDKVIWFW